MFYNINKIIPSNYKHSDTFIELIDLLYYSLQDLNHNVTINNNAFVDNASNIIVGGHLIDRDHIKNVPPNSILLNTEQLNSCYAEWKNNILELAHNMQVWDYSTKNIHTLNLHNLNNVKHLHIGYHEKLNRIQPKTKDIDILFYGSINKRRDTILNTLKKLGYNVQTLFGIYGAQRDEYISRSKLVLNIHYYEEQIFEIVRVSYLVNNQIPVISEINSTTAIEDIYKPIIINTSYEDIVSTCIEYLSNDFKLQEHTIKAFNYYKSLQQLIFIKNIL